MTTMPEKAHVPSYSNGEPEMDTEKGHGKGVVTAAQQEYDIQEGHQGELKRTLKGRHMQMIAIGGAIGAGFFVGSGGALSNGGPGSLVLCFIVSDWPSTWRESDFPCVLRLTDSVQIIGFMLLLTVQALAELAVLYPVSVSPRRASLMATEQTETTERQSHCVSAA